MKKYTKKNKKFVPVFQGFYGTLKWIKLRKRVIRTYGATCMKRQSTEDIHVDHIKPRSKYKKLQYKFNNLQVLCRACNMEKSNLNEIDYRPEWAKGTASTLNLDRENKPIISVTDLIKELGV